MDRRGLPVHDGHKSDALRHRAVDHRGDACPAAQQMVFGDGHSFLYRFANCLDVIGHELTVRTGTEPDYHLPSYLPKL